MQNSIIRLKLGVKKLIANSWSLVASSASRQKGFTLLEAMLSSFILIVGITGSMTLVFNGITGLNISKNRLIAVNLAQEGLEVVHNIRDNNWLQTRSWNDWDQDAGETSDVCPLAAPCIGYVIWEDVPSRFSLQAWNFLAPSSNFLLRWNDEVSVRHYDNAGNIGETFYRIIKITNDPDAGAPGDSVRVQSIVGWGDTGSCNAGGENTGRKYCLVLEEWLYDWRQLKT